MEMFYEDAMKGWRQTGEVKFANLALRVTAAQAKLPALSFAIQGLLAGEEKHESEFSEDVLAPAFHRGNGPAAAPGPDSTQGARTCAPGQSEGARTDEHPPAGDCSPSADFGVRTAESGVKAAVATPLEPKTSARLSPAKRAARRAFLAGAQPLLGPELSLALRVGADAESPVEDPLSAKTNQRKLSRRERKRLRRAK
jgi:hypothetical protein